MSEKKGKALVKNLIDDLLNDKSSVPPSEESEVSAAPPPPTSSTRVSDDDTLRLGRTSASQASVTGQGTERHTLSVPSVATGETRSRVTAGTAEIKPTVGRIAPLRSGGFGSATEAALATSENLRIAQNRILQLEEELHRLRGDNEQLAAAGETLRRRADELLVTNTSLTGRLERVVENKDQEIDLLRQAQRQREVELTAHKLKVEELEMRLSTNIQKIRVRERELENRLELVKMEGTAIVRSKDEIILDHKRLIDQLNMELENYRNKGQELNRQLGDKQDMLRRTVKALRLALSLLEGEEEPAQLKKAK
jgi:hypothetical protein